MSIEKQINECLASNGTKFVKDEAVGSDKFTTCTLGYWDNWCKYAIPVTLNNKEFCGCVYEHMYYKAEHPSQIINFNEVQNEN